MELVKRVISLTNGDLVIGDSKADGDNVLVVAPYSIYDTEQGPAVMPYMLPVLMEPMETVTLRSFDIMWTKRLEDFPQVESQYIAATTGLMTEPSEQIIL